MLGSTVERKIMVLGVRQRLRKTAIWDSYPHLTAVAISRAKRSGTLPSSCTFLRVITCGDEAERSPLVDFGRRVLFRILNVQFPFYAGTPHWVISVRSSSSKRLSRVFGSILNRSIVSPTQNVTV